MSNTATVITTKAGEALIAQMQAENKVLVIDKFIFANVPNRPAFPDRDDVVPVEHVVHESAVHEQGRLTENSVIYSTTLASNVGPFSFNWSGLFCSEHNVLVAINFPPPVDKTVDAPGITGNTLVRSFVLEYKGISETTNITVDPSSWQYDAHKRMSKMDNDTAQAIIDQNGKDWFIDDGFIVTPESSAYSIKAGAGYVSGHRISLDFDRIIQVPEKPAFIYVDAFREGSPTGEWQTKFTFVVSVEEKDDYTDAQGVNHFVCKIAQLFEDGSVSMLRKKDKVGHYVDSINNLHTTRDAIEWRPNLKVKIKDALQLFSYTDEYGVKSYYLPNVDELPFVTSATFADDVMLNRFCKELISTIKYVDTAIKKSETLYKRAAEYKKTLQDGGTFKIACFGDSTMWGATNGDLGLQNINNMPKVLGESLNLLYGVSITPLNRAISGTALRQMLEGTDGSGASYETHLKQGVATDADVIYCNHCINDSQLNLSIGQYQKDLIEFIRITRKHGKMPVLVTPNPNPPYQIINVDKTRRLEAYVNVMRNIAESLSVDLVDNYYYMMQTNKMVDMIKMVGDGAHPSTAGYLQCGRNLAIPFVSVRTICDVGDLAGLANTSFYTNASKSVIYQYKDNRAGVMFSCEREDRLTGINYPFILDKPQKQIGMLGLHWGSGAKVMCGLAGFNTQICDLSIYGGNTSYNDWDAVNIVEVNAWAGLQIFSCLFDMSQMDSLKNGLAFSGVMIPESSFSVFRSHLIKENYKDYMIPGRVLSVNSFRFNDIKKDGVKFHIYDSSSKHPEVGQIVQAIYLDGTKLISEIYSNGKVTNTLVLSELVLEDCYNLSVIWRYDSSIDVSVGVVSGTHTAPLSGSLPMGRPMFNVNFNISTLYGGIS